MPLRNAANMAAQAQLKKQKNVGQDVGGAPQASAAPIGGSAPTPTAQTQLQRGSYLPQAQPQIKPVAPETYMPPQTIGGGAPPAGPSDAQIGFQAGHGGLQAEGMPQFGLPVGSAPAGISGIESGRPGVDSGDLSVAPGGSSNTTREEAEEFAGQFKPFEWGDENERWKENWLEDVFGGGASFDPQQERMDQDRDQALRNLYEGMAGRGMSQSGAQMGMAGDIYRGASMDSAQAFQDWRQTQIGNKERAAQMLFQDSWKDLDFEHQKSLQELMYELDRKRQLGDDWESGGMGDREFQMLMDLMASGELGPGGSKQLEMLMRELWGDEAYERLFGKGDPSTGGAPDREGTQIGETITGSDGNWWKWSGSEWERWDNPYQD